MLQEKERIVNILVEMQILVSKRIKSDPLENNVFGCFRTLVKQYSTFFDSMDSEVNHKKHYMINVEKILSFSKLEVEKPMFSYLSGLSKKGVVLKTDEIHPKLLVFIAKNNVILKLLYDALETDENDLFLEQADSSNWELINNNILNIVK